MNLDIRTIIICIFINNLFSAILTKAYNSKNPDKTINIFIAAKWFQIVGFISIGLINVLPDFIPILGGNSALLIGAGLETVALLKLIGKWSRRKEMIYKILISIAISLTVLTFFYKMRASIRFAEVSFFSAIFIIYPVKHLLTGRKNSNLRLITALIYIGAASAHLIRAVVIFYSKMEYGIYTQSIVQYMSFFALLILSIGGNIGFVLLAKENADEILIKSATFDSLTNIYNRRTFLELVERELLFFKRKESQGVLLLLDLDFFKNINDFYGHIIGDEILVDFSNIIKKCLREYDLFGRYGGEEFLIYLRDTENALEIAERLRKSVEKSEHNVKYTVSIGLTIIDKNQELKELIKEADLALYRAKNLGRNRVSIYEK